MKITAPQNRSQRASAPHPIPMTVRSNQSVTPLSLVVLEQQIA